MDVGSAVLPAHRAAVLLRRGRALEVITLGWNVAGIVVLAVAALDARSVATGPARASWGLPGPR